jgi:hypothetical protein
MPGSQKSYRDCPLALASVYYDVLNHVCIDSGIFPMGFSEKECAALHQSYTQANDLILLDRGYNAFWLYAFYQAHQQLFCMRAKTKGAKEFKAFAASGKSEQIITLNPVGEAHKTCHEKGLSIAPITVRLIRVELGDEVEVLVTNLMDKTQYPASEFKALYHLRWGIEENYKRFKQWVEIENFTGKSVLSVKQDFYARIVSLNVTTMAVNAAQKQVDKSTRKRKLVYQVNFAQALSKMKNTVVELLHLTGKKLYTRLKALVQYIACTIEPIRPNRSYKRIKRKPNKCGFYMNYKRAK